MVFVEIILILLAIVIAYILYKVLKSTKKLAVNIIGGFIILLIAYLLGWFPIPTGTLSILVTIVVTALTGIFGALLLVILSLFGLFPF